jgi:hypothetical protein
LKNSKPNPDIGKFLSSPGKINVKKAEAAMSSDEPIEGRNLINHGDFSGNWREVWTVTGNHAVRKDSATGKTYLQMTEGATLACTFELPVRPDVDAVYWFSFSYEVRGNKPSVVSLTTGDGKEVFREPFFTRRSQEDLLASDNQPLADFRPYAPFAIQGLERSDKELKLLVVSADDGEVGGIYVTDFKIDLRIVPLAASGLFVDDRSYIG